MAQSIAELAGRLQERERESVAARITACRRVIEEPDGRRGDRASRRSCSAACCTSRPANREAAITDYSEAIKLDPTNALAYFNRGNAYDQLGEHDLAIADYTEAIKLDPTDPDAFNNRGQAYDNKGEFDLAIADYTRCDPPRQGRMRAPFFNRGLALTNKGEYQRAIADFTRRSSSTRATRMPTSARGGGHEELGNEAAARADYRKALEIEPDHEEAKEGERPRAPSSTQLSAARADSEKKSGRSIRSGRLGIPSTTRRSRVVRRCARYFLLRASTHLRFFLL